MEHVETKRCQNSCNSCIAVGLQLIAYLQEEEYDPVDRVFQYDFSKHPDW